MSLPTTPLTAGSIGLSIYYLVEFHGGQAAYGEPKGSTNGTAGPVKAG